MHCMASSSGSLREAFVLGLSERLMKLNSLLQGLALSALAQQLNDPSFALYTVFCHIQNRLLPPGPQRTQGLKANSTRHTGTTSQSLLPRLFALNSTTFQEVA